MGRNWQRERKDEGERIRGQVPHLPLADQGLSEYSPQPSLYPPVQRKEKAYKAGSLTCVVGLAVPMEIMEGRRHQILEIMDMPRMKRRRLSGMACQRRVSGVMESPDSSVMPAEPGR